MLCLTACRGAEFPRRDPARSLARPGTAGTTPRRPLRCGARRGSTPSMAEAYGPGPAETMSRDESAGVRQRRLRDLIDRLIAADGLQGERLRAAGVTGGHDVTLDDLHR